MESENPKRRQFTRIVRWTARIWSLASMVILLGFVIGEGIHPANRWEVAGLVFYPLGISVGMVIGWWREGLGGMITILCLLIYYIIFFVSVGHWPPGLAWIVFAFPGFLFAWSGWRGKISDKK